MAWNWAERYRTYTEPWAPIVYAAWAFRVKLVEAIRAGSYKIALSPAKLRDMAFVLWYKTLNERFMSFEETTAIPKLVAAAGGVVLELGPGGGNQLSRYDKNKVTKIYGAESNRYFEPEFKEKLAESGMEDIYELILYPVEESDVLEKHGITAGSLDTILSIQVLCAVPNPHAVAKELYRLLKPGGRLIFWEHHANSDWLTRLVQNLWNPAWRLGVGGCNMNRDMRSIIRDAGEWENFESIEGDERPWSMLPRIWGDLVKVSR